MPARPTPFSAATPLASVVAEPAAPPFSVNATDSPDTGLPPDVRVALTFAVPPNLPDAASTARLVAEVFAWSLKHTCTDDSDGVTAGLPVVRIASYLR